MSNAYPRSFDGLAGWVTENAVSVAEARHRLAQYVVLCGIASVPALRESLVFKGGNALDFAWLPNRSTRDLDFSLDDAKVRFRADADSIRQLLQRGLIQAATRFESAQGRLFLRQGDSHLFGIGTTLCNRPSGLSVIICGVEPIELFDCH